jgi:hypothetical protein
MASDEPALRSELKQVEDLIARTRSSAGGIHQEIGSQDEGPLDSAETSELFSAAQEQEALLGELELRRDELRRRLGMDQGEPNHSDTGAT